MHNKSFIDYFLNKKIHSEVILSGIYFIIFTRITSLFRAGQCTLKFLLTYTDGCRAYAMLKPLCEMRRLAPRCDLTRICIIQCNDPINYICVRYLYVCSNSSIEDVGRCVRYIIQVQLELCNDVQLRHPRMRNVQTYIFFFSKNVLKPIWYVFFLYHIYA